MSDRSTQPPAQRPPQPPQPPRAGQPPGQSPRPMPRHTPPRPGQSASPQPGQQLPGGQPPARRNSLSSPPPQPASSGLGIRQGPPEPGQPEAIAPHLSSAQRPAGREGRGRAQGSSGRLQHRCADHPRLQQRCRARCPWRRCRDRRGKPAGPRPGPRCGGPRPAEPVRAAAHGACGAAAGGDAHHAQDPRQGHQDDLPSRRDHRREQLA